MSIQDIYQNRSLETLHVSKGKIWDLAAASPLIAWYAFGIWKMTPQTAARVSDIIDQGADTSIVLDTFVQLLTIAFLFIPIVFLAMRTESITSARGFFPRFAAIFGTFLPTLFIALPPAALPAWAEATSLSLMIAGLFLGCVALLTLGRSFSLFAQTRKFVVRGPYAIVRHPIYACEEIMVIGFSLQFAQPWSFVILAVHLFLQFARITFEEKVMCDSFPEYRAYMMRTARLLPYIY